MVFVIAAFLSSCDSSVTDSDNILSENIGFANAEAAADTFQIQSDIYSAADGTITVEYLGEEVSIDYKSSWSLQDIAGTLCLAIKDDEDIEILATNINYFPEPSIRVRERRDGAQYNGNPVYLSDSNSTNHVKLSHSVIYLTGGED